MNIKKIICSVILGIGCLTASAQEPEMVEVFNPHWYVQAQGGAQYNLGEVSFSDLVTPNIQVAAGYKFTSVMGLRLSLNAWQSRAGSNFTYLGDNLALSTTDYNWKWKYVSPMVDATVDLTNLFGGYKQRVCSVGLFAGIGANIAFDNDDAQGVAAASTALQPVGSDVAYLRYLWDGTKTRLTGRVGANLDFHVTKRLDLGLEVNANVLSDRYNSKKADNADWYVNGLFSIKVNLGKTSKKVAKENPCGETIVEKVVEKIVEKPVEKIVYRDVEKKAVEPLRRDIFFLIRGSEVSDQEMRKVEEVVEYLKKNSDARVTLTGYADKGTGNANLNRMYSERRANVVAKLLKEKGIAENRITVVAKGDSEQPFEKNELNRVTICVAQ